MQVPNSVNTPLDKYPILKNIICSSGHITKMHLKSQNYIQNLNIQAEWKYRNIT